MLWYPPSVGISFDATIFKDENEIDPYTFTSYFMFRINERNST